MSTLQARLQIIGDFRFIAVIKSLVTPPTHPGKPGETRLQGLYHCWYCERESFMICAFLSLARISQKSRATSHPECKRKVKSRVSVSTSSLLQQWPAVSCGKASTTFGLRDIVAAPDCVCTPRNSWSHPHPVSKVIHWSEIKTFHNKWKLKEFVTTHPALQKMLKDLPHTEIQNETHQHDRMQR